MKSFVKKFALLFLLTALLLSVTVGNAFAETGSGNELISSISIVSNY